MDNEKFKQIETLMELDARHDAILSSLEKLDKQIEEAIRLAQEGAANADAPADVKPQTQTPVV